MTVDFDTGRFAPSFNKSVPVFQSHLDHHYKSLLENFSKISVFSMHMLFNSIWVPLNLAFSIFDFDF